jgi:nicotinamide phosphoribosyltransferase
MTKYNAILNTDSYKVSHFKQYKPDTEIVNSYIESRGGEFDQILFFGLQAFLKEYMSIPITMEMINEAERVLTRHGFEFNRAGFERIVHVHKGYWPVVIEAAPEGTILPVKNVVVQLRNTDPELPWVTSYLETAMLRAVWYPSTVATLSYNAKKLIAKYLTETGDIGGLPFKLHDFGYRGVSSMESGKLGGLAHLVNFMGTDTLGALEAASEYYGEDNAGFSIPASEHSTMTSWGGRQGEAASMENMLDQFLKEGTLVACVSDSYNLWGAIEDYWGTQFRERIMNSGGTLVIRPDSGDPVAVPVITVELLGEKFGYTVNEKGYKVLHPSVRVIQGDGINLNSIAAILESLKTKGWSADNIAFGMGGALLQGINRDTMKWAMKTNAIYIDGEWQDVYKDPITDPGKGSKRGLLSLVTVQDSHGVEYSTVPRSLETSRYDILRPVWSNGQLLIDEDLATIRNRARI